jgi:hypothetical protein
MSSGDEAIGKMPACGLLCLTLCYLISISVNETMPSRTSRLHIRIRLATVLPNESETPVEVLELIILFLADRNTKCLAYHYVGC